MAKNVGGKGREGTGRAMPASRTRLAVLAGLSAAGTILSVWLTWIHVMLLRNPGATSVCNLGGAINCDAVNSSRFSTLAGVPISWLGLAMYLALLGLAWAELRGAARRPRAVAYARWLGLASIVYSAFLAFLSAVVIQAMCLFCVGLYLVNLGLFATSLGVSGTRWRDFTPARDLGDLFRRAPPAARALPVAWLAGAVALFAFERGARDLELPTVTVGGAGSITVAPGHDAGRADAPLTVTLFSDFECPYCKTASASLDVVRERYGDRVRFVYKHFPLDPSCNPGTPQGAHHRACDAAGAAVCAGEQGKFWEFHHEVFEEGAEEPDLRAAAKSAGLDTRTWSQCRASERAPATVRADIDDGLRLNVQSTPTFLIGDQLVPGALSAEQLSGRIDRALGAGATVSP